MLHLAEPISVSCLHLRYKKHVCHLMRKATEEIAQLKAIPKPLAQSNREVPVPWISNRLSTRC